MDYLGASNNFLISDDGSAKLVITDGVGNVGIATTTPWRKLSVTGTVGFDGLTANFGAGSLCLTANKEVVYNDASENCTSSLRSTKHDINPLIVDALSQVLALQPVSFICNEGNGRTRFGFIAEDTAAVDPHLTTYSADGALTGIDDRSIIAILVSAIKDLWAKVAALMQSDEAQTARIQKLEEEVAALKTQTAAGAPSVGNRNEAPNDRPASGGSPDTDTATSTTPSALETSVANDNEPVVADDAASVTVPEADDVTTQEPAAPEAQPTEPVLEPANDNQPADLPATGTR